MKIQIINENESCDNTNRFIESKRDWNTKTQTYRLTREEQKQHNNANLQDCKIYQRGKYLIIEYNDIIHYWEYIDNPYNFFEQAIHYMELEKPAKWKTLERLIDLRMAIRQTEVNCCGFVETILDENKMSLNTYNYFMRLARKQDLEHHGTHTF